MDRSWWFQLYFWWINFGNSVLDTEATEPDPDSDYEILKHTMAAILYVEAQRHAEETKKAHDDLTIAPDEDNAEYKQKLDELLEEFW